ncbi:hypothetical protein ACFX11_000982 [Malus domestica]
MGSSLDRELDLEESHERNAVVNDDENIRKEEEESFCTAIQLVGSSVLPKSIQSAIELGVFDIIAKAGRGAKLSSSTAFLTKALRLRAGLVLLCFEKKLL